MPQFVGSFCRSAHILLQIVTHLAAEALQTLLPIARVVPAHAAVFDVGLRVDYAPLHSFFPHRAAMTHAPLVHFHSATQDDAGIRAATSGPLPPILVVGREVDADAAHFVEPDAH
jgi:hypothetical protein